jgi:putative transposase
LNSVKQIVGVDLGVNFLAVAYDSNGSTHFFNGREVKYLRQKYKRLRKQLQKKGTRSARRRLKSLGQKENRWMTDKNHCLSKKLVSLYKENTLFVLEDLKGVRRVTEKSPLHSRYVMVSWAFDQLRSFIEYKAVYHNSHTIAVNPAFTSQMCPKCSFVEQSNRNKKTHTFFCERCGFKTNDDRVAAMNLQIKGIEYIDMQ